MMKPEAFRAGPRALAAAAIAVLAATAGAAPGALAGESAGAEVRRVCFSPSISNWATISGEDNVVLLERRRNEWYRAELLGHCPERDLRAARTLAFDTRPSAHCVSQGDAVLFSAPGGFVNRCSIARISVWEKDAPSDSAGSDEE